MVIDSVFSSKCCLDGKGQGCVGRGCRGLYGLACQSIAINISIVRCYLIVRMQRGEVIDTVHIEPVVPRWSLLRFHTPVLRSYQGVVVLFYCRKDSRGCRSSYFSLASNHDT